MEFEEHFKEIMTKNRVEIVQSLPLERSFLFDYLLSRSVFDRNDCDLVQAEQTRERKASKFIDVLETKGREAFVHFINALQPISPGLYELVTGERATKGRLVMYAMLVGGLLYVCKENLKMLTQRSVSFTISFSALRFLKNSFSAVLLLYFLGTIEAGPRCYL